MQKQEAPNTTTEKLSSFDWRRYLKHPDKIPSDLVEKLDTLTQLANEDSNEGREFRSNVDRGAYRRPLLSLIQFFRDIVGEDRAKLFSAIEDANK